MKQWSAMKHYAVRHFMRALPEGYELIQNDVNDFLASIPEHDVVNVEHIIMKNGGISYMLVVIDYKKAT